MNKKNTKNSDGKFLFTERAPKQAIQNFQGAWFSPENEIVLNTSGSTGSPKTLHAPKKYLTASAQATGKFFNFSEHTTALHCLPVDFVAGKMMLIRILEFQMKAIFTSPSFPLEYPDETLIDFVAMTPYQYQKCLENDRDKLECIQTVLLGGASISDALEEKISKMKHHVFHSYGMTETYSHVALRRAGKGQVFFALEHVSFSQDSENCLIIHAPHLGIEKITTNDIVELEDEKTFTFLGRRDFVINSGGIKIHPEVLEKKWSKYLKTENFILVGQRDELLGERLVMLFEGKNCPDLQPFKTFFAKHEIPKVIVSCEQFAYTASGKIDRITTQQKYLI